MISMLGKRDVSIAVTILVAVVFLFVSGCDKGGGASNPVATNGSGGVTGTVYQDNNVQLSSAGNTGGMWIAFYREVTGFLMISEAHASTRLNLSNSSPSGGVLVELLLNGTVVASTTTGPNGKFEFGGLAPGTYTLRFSKGTDLLVTTTVNVIDGAMTEIEGKITLASSGNIHIKMEIEKKRTVDHYFEHEEKESEKKKNEFEIKGTVTSLSPLIVNSGGILYTVNTDSKTKFEGTLSIGAFVEVEGTLTGTNTILAKEVEVEKPKAAKSDKKEKDDDDDHDDDDDDDDDNDHHKKS
jgi:hypothetical protein